MELIRGNKQQLPMPKCNDCGTTPLPGVLHEVTCPSGLIMGIFCCANCGWTLTAFPLGMREAEIERAKIIVPERTQ